MIESLDLSNPRVHASLDDLKRLILERYPEAQFQVSRGRDDPEAIHLIAIVDVDDTDEVADLTIDREMALQIDEELPIFVIPTQPVERITTRWEAKRKKRTEPVAVP